MLEQLKAYIAACEENIVKYKEMGDEKAVKAAEAMIADFEELMANELDMINY